MTADPTQPIATLEQDIVARIAAATDEATLEAERVAALGKKGVVSELLKTLGAMPPEARQIMGPALNGLRDRVGQALAERRAVLREEALAHALASNAVDVTLPVRPSPLETGRIHPISQVIDEITAIFADLGFSVAEGPDIETDYYNFTALNFPVGHPAREMHDTFFFHPKGEKGERLLLRTHTSPVQIRTMEKQKPPIRVIIPGRTYRMDSDQTHTPMFHQVEGLVLDETSTVGTMKWVLEEFCKAFFEVDAVQMRFRPSFFPFTEPSMEVDIRCRRVGNEIRFGEGDDWLEILGCGMVQPNVIRAGGHDPEKVQGFAWGMGIDRIAMLKYGMPDLRDFYSADIRWLNHYGFRPLDLPTLLGGIIVVKFTLSWLKEHLETEAPLDVIVDKLTMIGLEVESVEDRVKQYEPFRIVRVISAEKHPNADRLKVCIVDLGNGAKEQVVCGAPNARAGMIGVFAPAGTHIPGTGVDLAKGVIRGVESNGMLLSERELGLSDNHDGIIDLPASAPVGQPYAAYAGLGEPVIDISVTPNRPDALGVSGIARDLAAAGIGKLIQRPIAPVKGTGACPVKVVLDFGGMQSLCPAFGLRLVRGVKNGPSPEWLQKRLIAIGLRPINALVDITNIITYDRGRPLHVFDAAKISGSLVVRRGKFSEEIKALDGKTYKLDPDICVIADNNGVESIAGIMGGERSGCDEDTKDVLIESALWEPLNIAHTGRKLGINSDARHRFERGVDPAFMIPGLELATRLVLEFCGGRATDVLVAGAVPQPNTVIEFPTSEVKRLTGIEPSLADMTRILEALGFAIKANRSGAALSVTVPSWRPDVSQKADIVEEVVRIVGVDKIPATPLSRPAGAVKPLLTSIQTRTRKAKRALAARGLVEAVTWSFVSHDAATVFGGGDGALVLANPIAADMSDMRPSLFPGLIAAMRRNADRGFFDLALFEVGQIYRGDRPEDQFTGAAGVRAGTATLAGAGRHWSGATAATSVFDAKADALAVLDALGLSRDKVQITADAPAWFHPGRSGVIRQGPKTVIGTFGEFHPSLLEALDATGPMAGFEIILEAIPAPKVRAARTKPPLALSDLQPVRRDFAFVVDRVVEAGRIVRAAEGADRKLISAVSVFDVFESEALGEGRKSVAIEVTLQPSERTMTEQEIEVAAGKIVAEVEKATGGTLRT